MNLKNSILVSNAVSIGNFAHDLLAQPGKGRVMGVTSHGFFFMTQSNRVIFISTESLLGPAHIILTTLPEKIKIGLMGAVVECSPDRLDFPKNGFQINLNYAKTWQPPELPKKVQSVNERKRQIHSVVDAILKSGREAEFLPILKSLVAPNRKPEFSNHQSTELIQNAVDLKRHVRNNEPAEAGRILDSFLGYGSGLTPSGDDFVWGFLAALNRWQAVICPGFEVGRLNEMILPIACQKTTSLSATLIESAAHGWADANMLAVLDCLITGEGSVENTVEKILTYGSSSGVDAFAGMALAAWPC
jgi:hypothetical protein